jgi:hypothetical protein
MTRIHFTLATMMGVIVVVAICVVALKESTQPWAILICVSAPLCTLGAAVHGFLSKGQLRAPLLGFALFSGFYFLLAPFWAGFEEASVNPTDWVISNLRDLLHPEPAKGDPERDGWYDKVSYFYKIGHCLSAMWFGLFGATWAGIAARRAAKRPTQHTPDSNGSPKLDSQPSDESKH